MQQGYDKLLQHLFEKAGYRVPAAAKEKMIQLAKKKEQDLRPQSFETLFQCQSVSISIEHGMQNLVWM